ncbi:MAG: phytanoyl-CoA dioxygenase family protein, partial [Candidatus Latescibacteria bacterium]|nr:phytanoyl-CoA dioxygenase family protein [Candidatus Latescibacterota bacterium]
MTLTSEQVQLFRHNGFLKLPGKLSETQVEALRRAILSDIDEAVEPVVRNAEGQVVRLSTLLDRDPIFRDTVSSSLVLDPLESLLGPNIEVVLNRHNHATLNLANKRQGSFHRDNVQWTRALVTVIYYLEETTLENGCTMVIPGTHL